MVSKDPSGDEGNFTEVLHAYDVLHYFYPKATEKELEGVGITPTQAVQWLNLKGYTAKIIDRALTTEEIKARLDNSEPIVTVLENQTAENWLYQHYAGVLYGHSDLETGVEEGNLHASFIKTINYGEVILNDGEEANNFQFSDIRNAPDPLLAGSNFKWASTITEIKRDPSWSNSQTIKGDRAKGVFEHKITSDGTQSQVDFTDPDVTALLNKYPEGEATKTTKLAAVSLINLYEDAEHQKTVKDFEEFLKISSTDDVTPQGIADWYQYLGFDFDMVDGRAPMALTKALNDTGRLYLTVLKAKDAKNKNPNTATIGAGYLNNSFNGYRPFWYALKLGENLVPFYDVPMTEAGMKEHQKLAKEFKYTDVKKVVSSPFEKSDYDELKTIYNIRLKGLPDESGITLPPSESVETPPEESDINPVSNASYIQSENFNIREIQGQVPWCSSFVNAAAVNATYKAPLDESEDRGAVTTARKLMQLDRPGVSDEELEKLPGTTIQNVLDVLKKNYQITTDFEQRTMSFEEVKKEIDAGGIIQIDGDNSEATDEPGTGDNSGHAVAIVGYVEPKEGGQAPYYIVWNPWWDTTFYLSSKAKTFNLGGVKYKWTRSWHNWRKIGSTSEVQMLDPELGNQKVASTPNPMTEVDFEVGNINSNKSILNQNVAHLGAVTDVKNPFSPDIYGFATGQMDNKDALSAIKNGKVKNVYLNDTAKQFKGAVTGMIVDRATIATYGLSLIVIMAVIGIVAVVPALNLALPLVTDILIQYVAPGSIVPVLQTCYDYRADYNKAVSNYNKL